MEAFRESGNRGYEDAALDNIGVVYKAQGRYALNQVTTFPGDISDQAQEKLPDRVNIRLSCNFDLQNQPRAIVLHYTEGSSDATIATF